MPFSHLLSFADLQRKDLNNPSIVLPGKPEPSPYANAYEEIKYLRAHGEAEWIVDHVKGQIRDRTLGR
jgi:hypothetical protein